MISVENPKAGYSKDWVAVARDYVETRFPDWHPQMVAEFASDIDWRMEGVAITAQAMENAYEDWVTGSSPYSPHCVPNDGYDYEIWAWVKQAESRELIERIAREAFSEEPWNVEKFVNGYMDDLTSSYTYERYVLDAVKRYREGTVPYSPHWIPMTAEGLANREERIEYLMSKDPKRSEIFGDLWYCSPHGYGELNTVDKRAE